MAKTLHNGQQSFTFEIGRDLNAFKRYAIWLCSGACGRNIQHRRYARALELTEAGLSLSAIGWRFRIHVSESTVRRLLKNGRKDREQDYKPTFDYQRNTNPRKFRHVRVLYWSVLDKRLTWL